MICWIFINKKINVNLILGSGFRFFMTSPSACAARVSGRDTFCLLYGAFFF